jgi:hypothetical protein
MDSLQLSRPASPPLPRWLKTVMGLAAISIVVCCGLRTAVSWHNYGDLEREGGIWTALAVDLCDGTLYRPLVSDLGYGGTRYAPLHFALQASLMKAGIAPITSGFLLGVAALILAIAGFFTLMRRLDVPAPFAGVMVCFFIAAFCVRSGILAIKGDLLAAALNVWGLAVVARLPLRPTRPWPTLVLAALLFVLTFMTKVTDVFGIAASLLWLILNRRRKAAILLGMTYAAGVLLAVLMVQWASDGRAIAVFRACASAAAGWGHLIRAPSRFFPAVFWHDKAVGGFWVIAIALLLVRRKWTDLTTVLLIVTSVGTLAIFGTRGININHLIDLYLASLLLLAVQFRTGGTAQIAVPLAMSAMVIHAAVSCLGDTRRMLGEHRRHYMEAALTDVAKSGLTGPILAENPILPILAGQRPYILDPIMLSVLEVKYPGIDGKLLHDLASQRFSAVVITPELTPNTRPTPEDPWPALLAKMKQRYELTAEESRNLIYLPKGAVHGK